MERLGRYLVLDHLASGGMADVLLARSDGIEGFERHVVVKRIREELAADPMFIEMFLDEARVAANLHHQHIVQVNDIGQTDGNYFFAMEYIHGEDVRAILAAAAQAKLYIPLAAVVAIVSAAAAGLHYAHERRSHDKRPLNIVHCDVSPSNILVGYDGAIKVVDFGIAKAALRADDAKGELLKGKAAYMSPEQCTSGTLDRRSDVFSLGIVLYELATTTRLFRGDSDQAIRESILYGRPALPRTKRPELPNELSLIIMKALEVDPARRYQTADELRFALDQFATHAGLAATGQSAAALVRQLFGERPEPWLTLAPTPHDEAPALPPAPVSRVSRRTPAAGTDVASSTGRIPAVAARHSLTGLDAVSLAESNAQGWTDRIERTGSFAPGSLAAQATPGGRAARYAVPARPDTVPAEVAGAAAGADDEAELEVGIAPSSELEVAPIAAAPIAVAPSLFARLKPYAAYAAVPAGALIGLLVWSALGSTPAPRTTAQLAPTTPARQLTVTPIEAAPAPAAAVPVVSPPPLAQATVKKPAPAPTPRAPVAIARPVAAKAAAAPVVATKAAPAPAPVIETAPTPPPVPAPATPAVAAEAPKPAGAPPVAAAAVPADPTAVTLSLATISRVAATHAGDLAKCEGNEPLKGEVTVKFGVAPDGRVITPQITSRMGKPRVSACILRTVQRWRFARQGPGGAQGVYTLVFQ